MEENPEARPCGGARGGDAPADMEMESIDPAEDNEVRTLPCRLARKEQLAHDVMALYLKLPASERLRFRAGQYVDVLLRDGRRRAFSLANPPHDDAYLELHVRHVAGGEFSEYVFTHLRERAILRIRGPLGAFYLRNGSDRPVIFLAGGTGIAPIKGMIEHALAHGFTREMHLYFGARAKRDLYLDDLARRWAGQSPHLHYVPVLSEPQPEDHWKGRTGLAHEAVLADFADLGGYEVYTSGPPAMVYAAREAFLARGLDPAHLFSDAFEHAHATGHDQY